MNRCWLVYEIILGQYVYDMVFMSTLGALGYTI